jgi:two-component system phosphate regulon sensor histidine kinase PhoR
MNTSAPARNASAPCVLIVDPHHKSALRLAELLKESLPNANLRTAQNAREAVNGSLTARVDVLITDYWMPGMNGLELVERLQQSGDTPGFIVLLSAQEVPGLDLMARKLKVNHCLIRPVEPEKICELVVQGLPGQPAAPANDASAAPTAPFKILIADDRPDNVTLLTARLSDEGYLFVTANDGEEALARMRAELPDLVLLDVNMPKKDGFQVLAEMRADPEMAHIPAIILTAARLDARDIRLGFNLGADDYITKPFDWRELAARVRAKLRVKQAEDALRRRNRELSLLPRIGQDLSARLDVAELAEVVLQHTVSTLGASAGHLVVFQPDGNAYHHLHTVPDFYPRGWGAAQQRLVTEGLTLHVMSAGEGLLIEDTRLHPLWLQEPNDPTASALAVPLLGRYGVLGVLTLFQTQTGHFHADHLTLLQAIASQAAIAIENAQLYTMVEEEQQRSAAVLRAAAGAILVLDEQNHLVLLNPAGRQLFDRSELKVGQPIPAGRGYDDLLDLLEQACRSRGPVQGEAVWPNQHVFTVLVTPVDDGGHVLILHDVTHFKKLERAKNEFIAAASHDLKNPITSILGYTDLLKRAGPLNDKQEEYTNRIRLATRQMSELVQHLLELARIDLGVGLQKHALDLYDLLVSVVYEFKPQAEFRQQQLELTPLPSRPQIMADGQRLRQALRNLMSNAIKYTPAGGRITLSAELTDADLWVHVRDTGPGIPAKDLPHLFERFYRAQTPGIEQIEGNGLGLAIVKSVVEQHGGRVTVDSAPGQGARFSFSLPLSAVAFPVTAGAAPQPSLSAKPLVN